MRPNRVVAVLSGGGAKALAHAGAWLALEELGLRPGRVAGTSMGAVIGAAFAAGRAYDDVVTLALAVTRRDVAALSLGALGGLFASSLLRAAPLKATIARLVPARRFDELTMPLTVTAVDVDSGERVFFGVGGRTDIPLVDALYASCALPLYYPPLEFRGRRLVDGGLRCTLPLDAVSGVEADLVVAVDVGPGFDQAGEGPALPPLLEAHNRMIRVLVAQQTQLLVDRWHREAGSRLVVVRPVVERGATFALDRIARYVAAGYRATWSALG